MREGQLYRRDFFNGMKAFDRYGGDISHYDNSANRGWRDGWHARAEAVKRGREHERAKTLQMGRRREASGGVGRRGIYRDAEDCARRLGC